MSEYTDYVKVAPDLDVQFAELDKLIKSLSNSDLEAVMRNVGMVAVINGDSTGQAFYAPTEDTCQC